MATVSGVSILATGTITSGAASPLTFASTVKNVIVTNNSGAKAYFRINSATVSATVYDFSLADGAAPFTINDMLVSEIGVFVAATSGVVAAGWVSSVG